MDTDRQAAARRCIEGSENDAMTFPQIIALLTEAGFDGYMVDFRRAAVTYYLPDGENVTLDMRGAGIPVAREFDASSVQGAIREAQQQAPGYSYKGFCTKVAAAGCAGYLVSLPGQRVVYLGRTGDTHVEPFQP